jgi:hypothetical protein
VIGFHEHLGDIVEQAGEDDFFGIAGGESLVRALQNVRGRGKAKPEEVE